MSSAFGAGAGADALQEVLRQKLEQVVRNRQLRQDDDRINLEQQRQTIAQQQAAENSRFLNEQRAAAAAKLKAETEAAEAKRQGINQLLNDPSLPATTRQWMKGASLGWNQLTPHDYEAPDVHQAHVDADAKRKLDEAFEQHKRTRDYDNAHQPPLRIRGARVITDDPTLPRGSQLYIAQIASKHGGDYNAARAELDAYLNDPATARDHPNLSPIKAYDALKRFAGAPGGSSHGDALDQLINEAVSGAGVSVGGGRGAGPGAPVRIAGVRSGAGSTGGASDAALQERARQVLQQGGYAATPENIQKFLSNPANRQRLAGGQ